MNEPVLSNEQWVADLAKAHGAQRSPRKVVFTVDQDAAMVALYKAGIPYGTIAKEFVKRFNIGGPASIRERLRELTGE